MPETLSAHRPPALAGPVDAPADADLRRRLERLAARTGWTTAELIAEAIGEYLERRDRACVPSWVGAAAGAADARIGAGR